MPFLGQVFEQIQEKFQRIKSKIKWIKPMYKNDLDYEQFSVIIQWWIFNNNIFQILGIANKVENIAFYRKNQFISKDLQSTLFFVRLVFPDVDRVTFLSFWGISW